VTQHVIVAGPGAEAAEPVFRKAGVSARLLRGRAAAALREADRAGIRYTLVHVGADDGEPEGSYERAHHRVGLEEVPALAEQLRPSSRRLVTCLAFAYKNGLPPDATWVVDVRFLDNPYWVEELKEKDGNHDLVREYVLRQPAAVELLDRLEAVLRWALPLYQRDRLTVALGCTGGRHRSVVVARELARRLEAMPDVEVQFRARDLH